MNMDNGDIRLWASLTEEERESGRWVKLGDGEYAEAMRYEQHERINRFREIFAAGRRASGVIPPDLVRGKRRGFDATGKPYRD